MRKGRLNVTMWAGFSLSASLSEPIVKDAGNSPLPGVMVTNSSTKRGSSFSFGVGSLSPAASRVPTASRNSPAVTHNHGYIDRPSAMVETRRTCQVEATDVVSDPARAYQR